MSENEKYITRANYGKILRKIDIMSLPLSSDKVYKWDIYFLSDFEMKYLRAMRTLFKNPEDICVEIYMKVDVKDTYRYVYEGNAPSYHNSITCSRLSADYKNFKIPAELKERWAQTAKSQGITGVREIEQFVQNQVGRFRTWFHSNKHLLKTDPKKFLEQLDIRWNVQRRLEEIEKENSGVKEIVSDDLNSLEQQIDELLREAGRYFTLNKNLQPIIRRFQKLTFLHKRDGEIHANDTDWSDDELKVWMKEYEEKFKRPVMNLLVDYYRVKYNPELKMSGSLLEQLNFEPCGCCASTEEKKISDIILTTIDQDAA